MFFRPCSVFWSSSRACPPAVSFLSATRAPKVYTVLLQPTEGIEVARLSFRRSELLPDETHAGLLPTHKVCSSLACKSWRFCFRGRAARARGGGGDGGEGGGVLQQLALLLRSSATGVCRGDKTGFEFFFLFTYHFGR